VIRTRHDNGSAAWRQTARPSDPHYLVAWLAGVVACWFTGETAPTTGELAHDYRQVLDGEGVFCP